MTMTAITTATTTMALLLPPLLLMMMRRRSMMTLLLMMMMMMHDDDVVVFVDFACDVSCDVELQWTQERIAKGPLGIATSHQSKENKRTTVGNSSYMLESQDLVLIFLSPPLRHVSASRGTSERVTHQKPSATSCCRSIRHALPPPGSSGHGFPVLPVPAVVLRYARVALEAGAARRVLSVRPQGHPPHSLGRPPGPSPLDPALVIIDEFRVLADLQNIRLPVFESLPTGGAIWQRQKLNTCSISA